MFEWYFYVPSGRNTSVSSLLGVSPFVTTAGGEGGRWFLLFSSRSGSHLSPKKGPSLFVLQSPGFRVATDLLSWVVEGRFRRQVSRESDPVPLDRRGTEPKKGTRDPLLTDRRKGESLSLCNRSTGHTGSTGSNTTKILPLRTFGEVDPFGPATSCPVLLVVLLVVQSGPRVSTASEGPVTDKGSRT